MNYYSASTGGFYTDAIHGETIPSDAKPESAWSTTYAAVVTNRPPAKIVVADANGCPVLADPAVNLFAYANQKQWALLTGGYTITIAGAPVLFATDPTSLSFIDSAKNLVSTSGGPSSIDWQTETGFVQIAAADFTAAALQVGLFVQATYNALKTVFAGIAANTITTTAQVDAAFAAVSNVSSVSA